MPHSANKELILGIMVGTTGISLLLLWYHKVHKPRTAMNLPKFFPPGNTFDLMTVQDERNNGQGTAAVFQGRQPQILEKLNELLTIMEELKEEIRILKETIPKLEEYVHGELGRKTTTHRISPQHRARKRRLATVQSSGTSNSSEEAESEGGSCKEGQSFQPVCPADQVTSDPLYCATSSVTQPAMSQTSHPKIRRVSLSRGIKKVSVPPKPSTGSSFSGRKPSFCVQAQESNASLQSRVNFVSQEDNFHELKSPSELFHSRSRRLSSAPRLSIISCYESALQFDLQPSSDNIFSPSDIEMLYKNSTITNAGKCISSCSPDYNLKHFMNFETKVNSSASRYSVARDNYQQSTAALLSFPTIISYSYQENEFATDVQERSQLRKDSLRSGSQSRNTNHSPSLIPQRLSQSVTSVPQDAGYSSEIFTPFLSDTVSDSFEDKNVANSSQDEDKSSPIEIPKIRYVTANTDTEEQSFPVPKALNIHTEDLNLDVLLQKADNLRMNESRKMESFELLCDHKEKFKDEIEFIWRFVRAYGDMYELSTNTQEKKHYANIGKTLGEKAVTRAPRNGHCHLWYAILCGYVSEFEGLQNKINYGHLFKEHLDKAIQFLPEEPFLYYLRGRYCYTISKLSWIERKMAATLFGKIPSSTVEEALQNFLKVEELHPGFSKSNYVFLAKCCVDLKQTEDAVKFCNLTMLLPCVTREDKYAEEEVKKISTALKR